ncbi:MAG: hypothetical protein HC781_01605 [Leptolyngbyaceae cyanobacterium CSU_1_4]|nr:hypothetical protein [Leptolyngbyaceae cyanobacterium CSU_1_4]
MMTQTPIVVTDSAIESLNNAAQQLQAHYTSQGLHYNPDDLKKALTNWLELQIEALAEDAFFHTVEGRDDLAQGRRTFQAELARFKPSYAMSNAA